MYVEKRILGKNVKYFLVQSYREKGRVRKIRKLLGQNLTKGELKEEKDKAKKYILVLLKELRTEAFLSKLTKNQIKRIEGNTTSKHKI